jgi:hypothetical protein
MKLLGRGFSGAVLVLVAGIGFAQTGRSTISLDNQSGEPALVKLVGPTGHIVEVPSGTSRTVNVTAGEYYLLARYGSDPGRYAYSRGNPFKVEETASQYSAITITLHKVVGGNYPTQSSSRAEFDSAVATSSQTTRSLASKDGPWELRVDYRTAGPVVFGQFPPPEGQRAARLIRAGTTIDREAFGDRQQSPSGKFLEIRVVLRNTTSVAQRVTLRSMDDFVLEIDGKRIQPFGIRSLGLSDDTPYGMIREFSGAVEITVNPGSEDSVIVVLFDVPLRSENAAFRFWQLKPVSIIGLRDPAGASSP